MSDDDDLDDFQPFSFPDFGDDIPFVDDLDDEVNVPVIEVEHYDDDLGDGEVFDIVILDVASPVVFVIDISSDIDDESDTIPLS
ncbi:hypothetical protein Hanom_Chr05g00417091 [Helianthus anomalus]